MLHTKYLSYFLCTLNALLGFTCVCPMYVLEITLSLTKFIICDDK